MTQKEKINIPDDTETNELISEAFKEEFGGEKPKDIVEIPVMITHDMKQQLLDLGWEVGTINNLKPQEAWKIIGAKKTFNKRFQTYEFPEEKIETKKISEEKEDIETEKEKEFRLLDANYQNNLKIAEELYGNDPQELENDIKDKENWYKEEKQKIEDKYSIEELKSVRPDVKKVENT
jgi:hypothetical protein